MEDESDDSSDDEVQYSEMLQPPLINQLKKILDEYPDDGQILKEIIQNAEDAEASLMKVLYDDRKINQDISSTKKQRFKKYFKGPALCIYNNATFTESDWQGIRMINSSVKEFDPVKVGRFGLGFKSVFHITDYPLIISGKKLLILDPHQESPGRVCMTMKLKKLRKSKRMDVTDCLAAFEGMFGFSTETIAKGSFQGTLFRFPLREEKTELSENIYDEIKVMDLFEAFKAEAPVELLFLKCLERIDLFWGFTDEIYRRDQDYTNSPVYSVNISESCVQNVREGRNHVMNQLETYGKKLANETFRLNYRMTIETIDDGNIHTDEWIIFHSMQGGNMSEELRNLSLDESLSYSPYTSIAIPMEEDQFRGHVFCLMPLPLTENSLTGLPVHVNGYFALSQNRRHVKWPTADQMRQGTYKDKSLRWNNCLITEVLAELYYNVIVELIKHTMTSDSVAIVTRTIPDYREITEHWKNILEPLFDSLFKSKFLFTENNGGCWICIGEAVFDDFEADTSTDIRRTVLDFLLLNNENIVHSEEKIVAAIKQKGIEIVTITGRLVAGAAIMNPSYLNRLPELDKMNILQFLLSCEDQGVLQGVPLLPLHNGCFTKFDHNFNDIVYVSQDATELFPGLEDKFIKQDLEKEIYENLLNICTKGLFQLHEFSRSTDKEIAGLLGTTIQKNIEITIRERLVWKTTNIRTNETWLKKVWKFLKDRKFDFVFFKDLFIVPIMSGDTLMLDDTQEAILCKLSKQFIIKSSKDFTELPDGVCRCLSLLDIVILPALWGEISEHPAIDQYVFKPTVDNVCRLLETVSLSSCRDELINTFNQECTTADRDDFVSFMSVIESIPCRVPEILSSLELFTERHTCRFVSRNDLALIVHTEDLPVQYFVENIDASNNSHYNLAVALEMDEIDFSSAVMSILKYLENDIGCYSEIDQRNVLHYALTQLKRFPNKQHVSILKVCKHIRFVYDHEGRRKCASEYFDPEDEGLKLILVEADFPDLRKTNIDLKYLRKLGLKSANDLTENHISRCTKEIHYKCTNGRCNDTDFARSSKIMELLSSRPELLTDGICDYHFVEPVKKPCLFPSELKWFDPQFVFCKPNDLLDEKYQKLVGCVLPLVSSSACVSLSIKCLWNKTPDVKNVIVQLLTIVDSYEDINKPQLLPLISDIFHFLVDNYGSYPKEALDEFKDKEWIWVGSKFVRSKEIYFSKNEHSVINFEPYLYTLPGEFQHQKFKTFFTKTKFCQSDNPSDLCVEVLRLIKKKHDTNEVNEKDTKEDLQLVVKILNVLKEGDEIDQDVILFPVHTEKANKLVLQPASKCNYCNEDWLKDSADDDGDDIYYVHHDIPMDTAAKLGVPSLTDRLLQNTEGLEEWGQHEQLTTRLKTLLKEYKDGFSVFKELIQNADDAGATKVCFLYDERQNKNARKRLIDKGMAECQGPALWSFNDAQFSNDDLENITKLNGATKELDTAKIGRFGLGFCSVYNLTDVPSFISGNNIVIFDPHTKHLGLALMKKKQPGIKINMSNNRHMLQTIRTQFLPFEGVFDCNLTIKHGRELTYDGTLFRFPLRTKSQGDQSEISHMVYDRHEMMRLLNMFVESGGNLLLFTQNVMSVELYYLQDDGRSPKESKLVLRFDRNLKQSIDKPLEIIDENSITTVLKAFSKLKLQKQLKQKLSVPSLLSAIFDISVFSRAEDDIGFKGYSYNTKWMITWERGTTTSWDMTMDNSLKGVLAIASIACPVKELNGEIHTINLNALPVGFYKTSHVFCFLPLPIETNLPVHINGFFAVTGDRQRLCSDSTDDKSSSFENSWNKELMKDAVCNAYVKFLEDLQNTSITTNEKYFERWPQHTIARNSKNSLIEMLQIAVYRSICEKNSKVFRTEHTRVSLESCIFLHPDITESDFGKTAIDASYKFKWYDQILIELPRNILSCFEEAGCSEYIKSKIVDVFQFYKTVILPNYADNIWNDQRDEVIIFALQRNDQNLITLLQEYPCIPTEPNGKLKCPGEIVDRRGNVSNLFDSDEECFILKTSQLNNLLNQLEDLQIIKDTLSPEMVIDRANSVTIKSCICTVCAVDRCSYLIQYLTRQRCSNLLLSQLRSVRFLPVMGRPEQWVFSWDGDSSRHLEVEHTSINRDCNHEDLEICFQLPENLCFEDCFCLVGTIRKVLMKTISDLNPRLMDNLGVKSRKQLELKSVMDNLHLIIKESQDITIAESIADQLNTITTDIYAYLNDLLKRGMTHHSKQLQLFKELRISPCIYVEDSFQYPSQVFVELSADCRPHLYSLQHAPNLRKLNDLLHSLGIKKHADTETVMKILAHFRNKYKTTPLPNADLGQYVCILNQLEEAMQREKKDNTAFSGIFAPDENGVLTSTKLLCVEETGVKTRKSMRFSHNTISAALASSIGIISMRKKKIKICSRSLSFGQREELTTRIKGILDGYPFDSGFLKELIQNADDAKASEVHIVVDFHHHPSDKVFDDSWKPLQGPSLLIYNDSSFSEEDLEGIQNLGKGSKRNDPTKTGQYGVGFNVVYHLTDVPSFLTKGPDVKSGQVLCVLDPNCQYVPEATQSAPGIEYFDLGELWDDYSDVFDCYHSNLLLKEKGTIFRLPLRTSLFAKRSKITRKETDEMLVRSLLRSFMNELNEILLFLNHVERIKVSEIEKGSLKEIYWVEGINSHKSDHQQFNLRVSESAKILRNSRSVQEIPKSEIQYSMTVKDSNKTTKTFLIVRQLGLRENLKITDIVRAIKNEDLNLLPRGGVAFQIDNKEQLVKLEGKTFCFLPLPNKTGLPVHFNGHFVLDHETRRNLWNEPNDCYKLNWNLLILNQIVAHCYVSGLSKLITLLNLSDPTQTQDEIANKLTIFHSVFPNIATAKCDYVKYLVKCVYQQIFEENVNLFAMWKPVRTTSTLIEFVPPRGYNDAYQAVWNCLLPEFESVFPKYISKLISKVDRNTEMKKLSNTCKCLGVRLVDTPSFVYTSMLTAGLNVKEITPSFLIMFLKTVDVLGGKRECRVDNTNYNTTDNLKICLKYCLKCKEFNDEILGLPLCLRQDDIIQRFDEEHAIYCTHYYDLFPESASMFLHEILINSFPSIIRGIKHFSLDDLTDLMPYTLSIENYRTLNRIVEWNPNSKTFPNRHWIERFWNFIDEEIMQLKCKTSSLDKLMPWCLLPCKIKQSVESRYMSEKNRGNRKGSLAIETRYEHFLYPTGLFQHVLNIHDTDAIRKNLADVVEEILRLPTLDIVNKFLYTRVPNFRKAKAVSQCLYLHKDTIQNRLSYVSPGDADAVLEYISDCLFERTPVDDEVILWIRSLPLHVTVTGHLVSLVDGIRILVLPDGMPTGGIALWAHLSRTILLRKNRNLEGMHISLQCSPREICDTYTRFVLRSFDNLPRKFHIEHLEYLRDNLLAMPFSRKMHPEQRQLIQTLADVAFVPDIQDNLQLSSYFCSPFNHVMREMCDALRFPCKEFWKKEWQKLLEWTGIEKEISAHMVIEFTKTIAETGKFKVTQDIIQKSNIVVDHILSRSDITDSLLGQISNTMFIVPHEIPAPLQNIFKSYKPNKLICLSGSVMYDHTDLCWSTCTILPKTFSTFWKYRNDLRVTLGLLRPENKKVIQHIQNVVDDLHTKGNGEDIPTKDLNSIEDVIDVFYRWMKENVSRDQEIVRCLRYKPVVYLPNQRRFVTCERIVRNLDGDEFKQYLLPAPLRFGNYFDVFEKLGMKPKKSSYHYVKMSEYLYNEVGTNVLNKNDLLVVQTALIGLFKEVVKTNGNIRDDLQNVDKFYLPKRNNQLVNANNIVFSDNKDLEAYIKNDNFSKNLFIGLKALEVYVDDPVWCLNQLPENIRPKILSQIIKQKMNENLDYQDNEKGMKLSKLFKTQEFSQGCVRIIVHSRSKDTLDKKITVADVSELLTNIKKIRVCLVKTINFDLYYEQEIVGSCKNSCYFDLQKCLLFCAIPDEETLESWLTDNSHIINIALHECTNHRYSWNEGHLLKILLKYENVDKISKMLDNLSILSFDMPYKDSVFPDPGICVPNEMHCNLDNGFYEFDVGDYVAVLVCDASADGDDSIYVYAKIDKIVQNKTDDSLFSISQLTYRVEVDVGRYEILPGYRLYKFTRKPKSSELVPADTVPKRKVQSKDNELIYKETKDFIDRAWLRPEQERKKLVKRLYMQYHPDRNRE
ncbi:sacsin-like [Mytilus trossulus]|uniref:sacsin-like n=1 Tax=Mytilus trossulus TaxID=6551 RepID=UPI00300615E5